MTIFLLLITGEREVFYRQTRIGLGGRGFKLLKFATMVKDSPSIGAGEITLHNDPRVLPLGRLLRRIKANELPQLFNILKGDLSIVGPRPQPQRYYSFYREEDQHYIRQVRPGLSGIGSVIFRDEERLLAGISDPVSFDEAVIMPYKGRVERWFACNQSVGLYWKIIGVTVLTLFRPNRGHHRKIMDMVPSPPPELKDLL